MKRSKKILFLSLVSFVVLSGILFSSTLAFFKDEKVAVNKLKIGKIDVDVEEEFEDVPNIDFNGEEINKKVWINNNTNNSALVRVSITSRWINPKDEEEVIENDESLVTLNFKEKFNDDGYSDNWYKSNDGYYYYRSILKGNETTAQLLDSVTFNKIEDPLYKDKEFRVEVKAEAVQPNKVMEDNKEIYVYEKLWLNIEDEKVHQLLRGIADKNQ